jgi:hypothetical protein
MVWAVELRRLLAQNGLIIQHLRSQPQQTNMMFLLFLLLMVVRHTSQLMQWPT